MCVVSRLDSGLPDLGLTIGILAQYGEYGAIGFSVVDDMGICRDLIAIADDKSRAAKAELRTIRLVVGADDYDRRLDFFYGSRQIGYRRGRQQKKAENQKKDSHIILFDAVMRDHSGDGVVIRGSNGWSSRLKISLMRLT